MIKSIEICAGAGGQALGLEQAGFEHLALVEIDHLACETLRVNRPHWNVLEIDLRDYHVKDFKGKVDLLAGGVPCPPFSVAGQQLGSTDERDLFPEVIRLAKECNPKAILIENVRGLLDKKFDLYRSEILIKLGKLGYHGEWRLLNAVDFGLSQSRPRAILVAFKGNLYKKFSWPSKFHKASKSVGELLYSEMSSRGWKGVDDWKEKANSIAPTIVGGSKKHGGADLGPTRAKAAWEKLGINGHGLADSAPEPDFKGNPKLTLRMTALLQGFPEDYEFIGKKTPAYRQVGNAFPPSMARAIGINIFKVLADENERKATRRRKEKVA